MGKKKVLVIEDDPQLRMLFVDILRDKYCISCVGTGKEGLQLLDKSAYDLLILDMKLPDMVGTDIMRQIQYKKLTTIIITGYLASFVKDEMVLSNMDRLFEKPFKVPDMQFAIERALSCAKK